MSSSSRVGLSHLDHTITGIATAIHSSYGLAEEMYAAQEKIANAPFNLRMKIALRRVVEIYDKINFFEYAVEEMKNAASLARTLQAVSDSESDRTIDNASLDVGDPERWLLFEVYS